MMQQIFKYSFLTVLSILTACSNKSDSASHKQNVKKVAKAPLTEGVVDSAVGLTQDLTYPLLEFDMPLELQFDSLGKHDTFMNYWDKCHIVGWSDDNKLAFFTEPSGLGMNDEYQLEFRIQDMLTDEFIFEWTKPNTLASKNLSNTLGIYKDNIIAKMKEMGIKPLNALIVFARNDFSYGGSNYNIVHSFESGSHDKVWAVAQTPKKDSIILYNSSHQIPSPFGKTSSTVLGYFYSHDKQNIAIILEENSLNIEGAIGHKITLIGCTLPLL